MISTLKNQLRKQVFIPGWYAVLINSNYILARGLSQGIKKYSHFMSGIMLDFGCGTKPYRGLFNVQNHIGVDIENPEHDNDLSFVDQFYIGKTIPFEDQYFDSVFSSEVLTHIFNIDEILPEINRVLKSKGFFLVTVPFVWKENEKPHDSVRYTSYGIKHLLEKNGFQIIHQEKKGNYLLACFQLLIDYIYSLFPDFKPLKYILTLLFIFPLNLICMFLSLILPANKDLFLSNIIVAKKNS